MKLGIGSLNSIAMRLEPSDTSEMVSQLLFGETFKILESTDQWIKIISDFDHYQGWVLMNQILPLNEQNYEQITKNSNTVSRELITYISDRKNNLQILSLGASLPLFEKDTFSLSNDRYDFDGQTNHLKLPKNELVNTAYMYLNTPFLWGGRTPFGLDCSGFVQIVYKVNGHTLFRDTIDQ
jgi:cell wall-associated NlpC family hydrolase